MSISAIISAMVEAAGRDRAERDERIALDGAIRLAHEDGEHGVSRPRQLRMVRVRDGLPWVVLDEAP